MILPFQNYLHLRYHHLLFDENNPEKEYSINFKVTNPVIAQYILISLLNKKLDGVDLGIDVTSINLAPFSDKHDIKMRLHQMIDEIIK